MGKSFAEIDRFLFSTQIHQTIMDRKETDPWVKQMIRANIPPEFWNLDFATFNRNVTASQMKSIKLVRTYCDKIHIARKHGFGFLFLGDNGVGKTTFQMFILKAALKAGYSAFYLPLPNIFRQIYLGFKYPEILGELQHLLYDKDFLAIGELGKDYHRDDASAFAISEFDTIFRHRREKCLPTSMDSNLSKAEVHRIYGDSIISLFSSRTRILRITGTDYRKESQQADWQKYIGS